MDVIKTINKLKTRYKLNQEQVKELMNYYEKYNKAFCDKYLREGDVI